MTRWRFEGANDPKRGKSRIVSVSPELLRRCRGSGRRGRRRRGTGRCRRGGGGGSGGRLRLCSGVNPARMNAAVQRLRHLGVDLPAKTGQATKRRLDMTARAAEPVVEIEVTKGGVEIVEPHQAHNAAAKPDAFRVSGRAVDSLRRFDEFVGLALVVLGGIGRRRRIPIAGFGRLVLGAAALGESAAKTNQEGKAGNGEVAQNRTFQPKHTSTHKFPDLLSTGLIQPVLMPFK